MDWTYKSQEQRSQRRVKSGLRRGSLRIRAASQATPHPGEGSAGGLGRVCVGARVEHVRDWNVLRVVEAEQMLVSECAASCLC